jgi:hypothetical protein
MRVCVRNLVFVLAFFTAKLSFDLENLFAIWAKNIYIGVAIPYLESPTRSKDIV